MTSAITRSEAVELREAIRTLIRLGSRYPIGTNFKIDEYTTETPLERELVVRLAHKDISV